MCCQNGGLRCGVSELLPSTGPLCNIAVGTKSALHGIFIADTLLRTRFNNRHLYLADTSFAYRQIFDEHTIIKPHSKITRQTNKTEKQPITPLGLRINGLRGSFVNSCFFFNEEFVEGGPG